MTNNVFTTMGFAQLTETPAMLSNGPTYWPAPAADASLPVAPTRLYKARVYPGIWVQGDAHAAVVLYRRWFDLHAAVAVGHAQEIQVDEIEIARLDNEIQIAQELASFHAAALQAAIDMQPLPDPPDSASDALREVLRIVAAAAPEYWEAAGVVERLAEMSDMMAELVATMTLRMEYLEESKRLRGTALMAIGAPPVPYVECVHDGAHIVDLPECYTIGADRTERSPAWMN